MFIMRRRLPVNEFLCPRFHRSAASGMSGKLAHDFQSGIDFSFVVVNLAGLPNPGLVTLGTDPDSLLHQQLFFEFGSRDTLEAMHHDRAGAFRTAARSPEAALPAFSRAGGMRELISPSTTYDIPPTSFVFNNIPAFCEYLLYNQQHPRFVPTFSTPVLCFQ